VKTYSENNPLERQYWAHRKYINGNVIKIVHKRETYQYSKKGCYKALAKAL
jgi:hypothetical protein